MSGYKVFRSLLLMEILFTNLRRSYFFVRAAPVITGIGFLFLLYDTWATKKWKKGTTLTARGRASSTYERQHTFAGTQHCTLYRGIWVKRTCLRVFLAYLLTTCTHLTVAIVYHDETVLFLGATFAEVLVRFECSFDMLLRSSLCLQILSQWLSPTK